MNAVLHEALVAALEAHAGLRAAVTGVFGAPPVRAALPYAVVGESVLTDWSTKDMAGAEGRVAIALHDRAEGGGEMPGRLRVLADLAGEAVAAMPRDLGAGWRVVSLAPVRTRIVRAKGEWVAGVEFRVRMLRSG